jgi:hypothetical protein
MHQDCYYSTVLFGPYKTVFEHCCCVGGQVTQILICSVESPDHPQNIFGSINQNSYETYF